MSVRHALLALLSEGPKYGLQLREEFEARTGEVWPLNVGQVYTTLQRLERDGLVESDSAEQDGPQKDFRITVPGADELARWLRTPPDLASPPRDELVMKVLVALRVPGTDVRDVIQVHRRYLVELMQQWTRSCSGLMPWSAGWMPRTAASSGPPPTLQTKKAQQLRTRKTQQTRQPRPARQARHLRPCPSGAAGPEQADENSR